ncbi:MAG: amidase family protein [Metamycoplasmataceae bacterium]
MRQIINKGSFEKAREELLNDNNNAVKKVFEKEENNKSGILKNCVFTLKENFAMENEKSTGSSKILENFLPLYSAEILNKLFDAGANIVAKVNCDELALGGTGTYSYNGIVKNPLDNSRIVGGSSSGSAATFTKNISFAIASDTGDSVRLPASYIGCVGFKPSYGAISRWGLFQYASSLDTVAWFSHNVNDAYLVAKTIYGKDEKDMTSLEIDIDDVKEIKPEKISYFDCFDYIDKEIAIEYKKFISKIESQGIKTKKIKLDIDLLNCIKIVYDIISFSEASSNLSNMNGIIFGERVEGESWEDTFTKTRTDGFGYMVQRRLTLGSFFLEEKNQEDLFLRAQKVRRKISNWFNEIHDECDVLIFPSSPSVAPTFAELNDLENNFMKSILTSSNLIGNPSLNFKLGEKKNLPFNITIDAKIYSDKKLFSYGLFLEKMWGGK